MNAKLEILNAYRIRSGKTALRAWKESNAKLDTAIAKFAKADPTFDAVEFAAHEIDMAIHDKPSLKEQLKASVEVVNGHTVTLAQIARELGLNPKICRARARRNKEFSRGTDGTWSFPVSAKAEIVAFLTK